jgi:hypothetical protein
MQKRAFGLVAVALIIASSCARSGRVPLHAEPAGGATCRADTDFAAGVRGWLSLPSGPADTIGKQPGLFKDLPALPGAEIVMVTDRAVCLRIALALVEPRHNTTPRPVSAVTFGRSRYLAWDFVRAPAVEGSVILRYYVLDDQFHLLAVVDT